MATTHASPRHSTLTALPAHAMFGAVGGLVGGAGFGIMMQLWGMMPMVAMLVGSKSTGVAWVVHLAISAFIGITFALLAGHHAAKMMPAAAMGLTYGAVWWVLGALVLMPAKLGMPLFNVGEMAWKSLAGHLTFGLLLGLAHSCVHSVMHRDQPRS
ncbi:hypothetical protein [Streptomyces halobius]|uniref:DUF1440 domain-containing protein n=1 Tax=Streptomyces halobius TaxID=2879846 RepID=A0ABY4MGX5_9ACTN|nr:hypothetical protein [Streptomyces halobius]UQA97059.1 hypothetical protein K9S39_38950 [Streptomyces halobius]